ncbi:ABC transporter ATP-binding protein [Sporichthya polymorpha]|uniref:ABC transporter ATP-binding protein n=1 Tax=Sporichthya polymorpha TaxID=35751 RepID=UPI0003761DC9|nr:ABC transporter ATP-binding protein [Sporichthya polymorpha]
MDEFVSIPAQGATGGIRVRGARRTYGALAAVDSIDLDARPGAVTALVGPSGSGKTTMLMMLATLVAPDGGEIRVAGFDPARNPGQVRARVGWMPDSFGTYGNLTPREVLEVVGAAHRFSRPDRSTRAAELLRRVGLSNVVERPVQVLNRGQQQRLGLARAMVHRPRILLLDEPTAGLDLVSRGELTRLLRELAAEGHTILLTAPTPAEVAGIADHVVLVAAGRTVSRPDPVPARRARAAAAAPWRIRALDDDVLLTALRAYGFHHCTSEATGVQVLLRGDLEAADLLTALVRDGVRVVTLQPAEMTAGDVRPGVIAGFGAHDGPVVVTQHHENSTA